MTQVCQDKTVKQQQPLLRGRGEGLSHTPFGAVQKGFWQRNVESPEKLKQDAKVQSLNTLNSSKVCSQCGLLSVLNCNKHGHFQASKKNH